MVQSIEWVIGMLCAVGMLILLWIVMIHMRVNRLRKEIEKLKKIAE